MGTVSKLALNQCATGSVEWELLGSIGTQTVSPGVKGKVRIYVCQTAGGMLSNRNPTKKGKIRPEKL